MAFLSNKLKDIGVPVELSLFTVPANQVAIEKIYFSECRPVSSIGTEDAPIEIHIANQGNEYLDLKRSRLYIKARILKADGSTLAANEKTSIINIPLQSIFSQIDVYMNGKLCSLNTSYYPWKAYLKMILSTGAKAVNSQLQSQLMALDTGDLDNANPLGGSNMGLSARYFWMNESKTFDMEGPIYEDIFRLDKYVVNGVDIQLKMFRSRSSFIIMSDEQTPDYRMEIQDVVFKVCKVKVDNGILINHADILKDNTAKYPLTRTEVKMNTIPPGSGTFIWQNVWSNNLPTRAIFGFVKQLAVNGNYTKNPFNFLNLAEDIALYVNGESLPSRPMKNDVGTNKNYVTAFVNLFEVSEKWNKDDGLLINRKMFDEGYAFYAFELAPNDLGDQYMNLVRQGNIRLEVKFAVNTSETVNCLAYGEFPALLEIDQSRDVKYTRA